MRARDIPNAISLLRIVLVIPVGITLYQGRFDLALYLFLVAAISDGLDGYLAKRFGWTSRLGSLLDPIADKLLLVTCYVISGWQALIPVWLVWAVIVRDLVILAGAGAYHFIIGPFKGEPTLISKVNTVAQIILIVLVMFDRGISQLPLGLIEALIYFVLLTTIASGLVYLYIWTQRTRLEKGSKP